MVVGCQSERDAWRFLAELTQRLERFGVQLHPEKTRIVELGRFAGENRRARGLKPETFSFARLTHICGVDRRGGFIIRRHTVRERLRGKLREGQGDDQADDAPADPGPGSLPEAGGERLPQLLPSPPTAGLSTRSIAMSAGTGSARCGGGAR